MKYCTRCGAEVEDNENFCTKCGASMNGSNNNNTFESVSTEVNKADDKTNAGFCILSFLIPIVGLILYLVWKKDYPIKAKGCGIAALVGFIINIIIEIIFAYLQTSEALANASNSYLNFLASLF